MRTSAKWINDYLSRPASAEEQAQVLTSVGFPCESCEPLGDGDFCQEVETTSNRGDCLSHIGLAREIAAATGREVKLPLSRPQAAPEAASTAIKVENLEPARCPRYTARVVRGVKVAPSPPWMQERLRAIGQIPRNNIVDCTNFVLFEFGQPTHVFDLAKLQGSQIQVRSARPGERFLPIGEGAREVLLHGGELVIADAQQPVALAGVKGGALSAVTGSTVDIVIEAAAFDPVAVRRTSRAHRIASDSSYRFERGVHPLDLDGAAERLMALIVECAGGKALCGVIEAGTPCTPARELGMRLGQLNSVAGIKFDPAEVTRILGALGFSPRLAGDLVTCSVPASRIDVTREIDLIEEVTRLAGLDRIPVEGQVSVRPIVPQPRQEAARIAKNTLAGAGFLETISHTLIAQKWADPFVGGKRQLLRVDDERTLGEPMLRPSLLPSLLQVLKVNADRGLASARVFEQAATFWIDGDSHCEMRSLCIAIRQGKDPQELFRLCRGACDLLVRSLLGPDALLVVGEPASGGDELPIQRGLSPAGTMSIGPRRVGTIGLVDPKVLRIFGLDGPIAGAEFDWLALAAGHPPAPLQRSLLNSPPVERDLSVVVDEAVAWRSVKDLVAAANLQWLESIEFVGTFRGRPIPPGRKSLTLRMLFRSAERTLRREEVDPQIASLGDLLTQRLHGEIRG